MQNKYGWVRKGDVFGPMDTSHGRQSWNWPIAMFFVGIVIGGMHLLVGDNIALGKTGVALIICALAVGIYLGLTTRRWESSTIHEDDLIALTRLLSSAKEFELSVPQLPADPDAMTNWQLVRWANEASIQLQQQYRGQLATQAGSG